MSSGACLVGGRVAGLFGGLRDAVASRPRLALPAGLKHDPVQTLRCWRGLWFVGVITRRFSQAMFMAG